MTWKFTQSFKVNHRTFHTVQEVNIQTFHALCLKSTAVQHQTQVFWRFFSASTQKVPKGEMNQHERTRIHREWKKEKTFGDYGSHFPLGFMLICKCTCLWSVCWSCMHVCKVCANITISIYIFLPIYFIIIHYINKYSLPYQQHLQNYRTTPANEREIIVEDLARDTKWLLVPTEHHAKPQHAHTEGCTKQTPWSYHNHPVLLCSN